MPRIDTWSPTFEIQRVRDELEARMPKGLSLHDHPRDPRPRGLPKATRRPGVTAPSQTLSHASISRGRRVEAWIEMGSEGVIRQHKDGRIYVDFGRGRRLWSLPVGGSKLPFDERLLGRKTKIG